MSKKKSKLNRKFVILGAAIALIIIVFILGLTNTTHIFHKQKVPLIIPAHTSSGSPINSSGSQPGTSSSSTPSSSTNTTQPPPDTTEHTLIAPFGNFVSNHFPGQNGSPTAESSVCNTSPGATCYIRFTNTDTNQTTQLATQTADSHGSTSWYWDVGQDAHLTTGTWQVTAVASLGSQTKSTNDALKLTIQ